MEEYLDMTGKEFLTELIFKLIKTDKDFMMKRFWVNSDDYYQVCIETDEERTYDVYYFKEDYFGQVFPIVSSEYLTKMSMTPILPVETNDKRYIKELIMMYEHQK